MRVKTANVLDFLSVPQKTSASVYEVLAKEATDAYEKDQTPPNQIIAEHAVARGFNRDQIHRVVELSNHQINTVLSKAASDQLFTFPVASVEGVEQYMKEKNTKVQKTASEEEPFAAPDFGAYDVLDDIPDYVDLLASKRFDQKLASMGKTADEGIRHWKLEDAPEHVQINAAKTLHKQAEANCEYAEIVLREAVSSLRQEWQKIAESPEDSQEFLYAGAAVIGIPAVKQLSASFGESAEKVAEALDPAHLELISTHIDADHPIVQSFNSVRAKTEIYGTMKEAAAASAVKDMASSAAKKGLKAGKHLMSTRAGKALSKPVPKMLAAGSLAAYGAHKLGLPITKRKAATETALAVGAPGHAERKRVVTNIAKSVREFQ